MMGYRQERFISCIHYYSFFSLQSCKFIVSRVKKEKKKFSTSFPAETILRVLYAKRSREDRLKKATLSKYCTSLSVYRFSIWLESCVNITINGYTLIVYLVLIPTRSSRCSLQWYCWCAHWE